LCPKLERKQMSLLAEMRNRLKKHLQPEPHFEEPGKACPHLQSEPPLRPICTKAGGPVWDLLECPLMRWAPKQPKLIERELINMKGKVVHCKKSAYDVYIGRAVPHSGLKASKWKNPFKPGKDGDREEVIEKFRKWILTQPDLMAALPELKGKILGCWCSPQRCHGDVLLDLAENV
jgi:hypothetical protein